MSGSDGGYHCEGLSSRCRIVAKQGTDDEQVWRAAEITFEVL